MIKPGNKAFKVSYLETVVQKDIPALPKTMRLRIKTAIETRLAIDPIGLGKPLRYSFVGHRRIRVGDYRIVYRIDMSTDEVIIVLIKHRKDGACPSFS
jgi:mRNA interferase RelE/StbE